MRFLVRLTAIGCVIVSSCGSDDTTGPAPACPPIERCGGNIVGTWNISTFCIGNMTNPFTSLCPSAGFKASVSGNEVFDLRADSTMTITPNLIFDYRVFIPTSCLGGSSCAGLQTQLAQQAPGTTCAASTAGCDCQYTLPVNTAGGGTYTTSGSTFTVQSAGGTSVSYSYCVKGNTLFLESTASGMTMTMTGTKQ